MLRVDYCNESGLAADERRLVAGVLGVLEDARLRRAQVSLAVVDDATIHRLNRRHLNHDYPTDVLSFLLEEGDGELEGEVVVSAETAASAAEQYGWPAADELLLYVIHGTLHLVGHDDKTDEGRAAMRAAEAAQLRKFDLEPPAAD